jgi:hypothetical protein
VLHAAGFATLAYEGRGGVDEAELAREVTGAIAFLRRRPDIERRRIGLAGAIGAHTFVSGTAGHGVELLAAEPVRRAVLDWLARWVGLR